MGIDFRNGHHSVEADKMNEQSTITINRKALLQSVRLAQADRSQSTSDQSVSLADQSDEESEESEGNDRQQFITFKREHVQQANHQANHAHKPESKPVAVDPQPPAQTVTRERTQNGRHSLRPTVKTIAPDEFSSDEDELDLEPGDDDEEFRSSRPNNKRKRGGRAAAKKVTAGAAEKAAAVVVARAPVAMSAGAVVMQKAGFFRNRDPSKAKPSKGKTARSRLMNKLKSHR